MEQNHKLVSALQSVARAAGADNETITRLTAAVVNSDTPARDKLITSKDAAAALGSCVATLFRYERAGKIRAIRRSKRSIRWRESEIIRLATRGAV